MYASTSKCQDQKVDVLVMDHLVIQFQGQILRAAANDRVCGHALGCRYAPTSPVHSSITGSHRKTAACHVTNPSICYNYCFIVLNCTYTMLLYVPLTHKVSSSSSSSISDSPVNKGKLQSGIIRRIATRIVSLII